MAINVSQSFHRTSANAIDDTLTLTKAQMLAINDNLMPSKYLTICQEDGKIYLYDKTATPSVETGKFSVFEGGESLPSGGTTGQLLAKKSSTDGDVEWKTIAGLDPIQVSEMPTASVDELGKIYQYIGSNTVEIDFADDASNFVGSYSDARATNYYSIADNNIDIKCGDYAYNIQCTQPLTNSGTLEIVRKFVNTTTSSFVMFTTMLGTTVGGNDVYESANWGKGTLNETVVDEIDLSQFDEPTLYLTFKVGQSVHSAPYDEWLISSVKQTKLGDYVKGFFYECKKYPDEIVDRTMALPEHNTSYTGWDMLPTINIDQIVTLNKSIKNSYYILNGVSSGQLHVDVTSVEVHEGDELGFRIFGSGYVASYKEVVRTYYWDEIPVQKIPPTTKTINFADFNALSEDEKNNGTLYCIPDAEIVTDFTVMGNRFDKANIYTEDERMIGSYLGKPLYQKSVELDFGTYPANTWTDIGFTIGDYEYGRIVNAEVWESNVGFISLSYLEYGTIKIAPNGSIQIYNRNLDWPTKLYITLQYTKTNDATVNIGTGNDYSTEEQVIGTWIDGKKLYQKTIDCGTLPNKNVKYVAHGISNLKNIINIFGCCSRSNDCYGYPFPTPDVYQVGNSLTVAFNDTNIIFNTKGDYSAVSDFVYVTIQYTKTTD